MPGIRRKKYGEIFKLEVLRDYYSSGLSIMATAKKWDITTHTTLLGWIKRYPIDSESLSLPEELIAKRQMKQSPESKEQLLEEEILRLKKALELETLRSHAFKRLIETAEKEEGISILKKDGAKQ